MAKKLPSPSVRLPKENDAEYLVRLYGLPSKEPFIWGPFKVYIRLFSPEECQLILDELNTNNRGISAPVEGRYRTKVSNGQWRFNGDSVRFDNRMILLDGQTRLQAHAWAKRPMLAVCVEGLDPGVMPTIDVPRRRSLRDALVINKVEHAGDYSVVLQWLARMHLGQAAIQSNKFDYEYQTLLNLRETYAEDLAEAIAFTCYGSLGRALSARCGKCIPAALYAAIDPDHRKELREFYTVIANGAGYCMEPLATDPAWLLVQRLTREPWRTVEKSTLLLWLVRAWNAWAEGRGIWRIAGLSPGEPFPAITGFQPDLSWKKRSE